MWKGGNKQNEEVKPRTIGLAVKKEWGWMTGLVTGLKTLSQLMTTHLQEKQCSFNGV